MMEIWEDATKSPWLVKEPEIEICVTLQKTLPPDSTIVILVCKTGQADRGRCQEVEVNARKGIVG